MFDKSRAMRRGPKENSAESSVVFPPIEDGKPLTQGQNTSLIPKTSGQVFTNNTNIHSETNYRIP